MTIDERRKYLHKMQLRYWQAQGRKERSRLLDEAQAVTGLHRKSLIRLLNGDLARKRRKRERGKTYGPEVDAAIVVIARSLDYPCAERLKPNLVWMARHLQAQGELLLSEKTLELLGRISVSSLRRRLPASHRAAQRLAHRAGRPAPRSGLKSFIPMRRLDWKERQPGHFEVDLVHHCGLSADGQYVHTLQMVDVASGWSECVGVLGRSWLVMQDGFERIRQRLPFEIRELHPDNGSEFLNAHLLRYWKDKVKAEVSRSRPFHKNDNRFVEENNFSLVRAYVGYGRLDTAEQTRLLNQLYDKLWLYHNFFQPVLRLQEKRFLSKQTPVKVKRIYAPAIPPLDRLIQAGALSPEKQTALLALREQTNPMRLREEIQVLIDRLAHLPCAPDGQVENVRLTLQQQACSHV
ncbi:MAG: hypothetical protein Kow0088_11870 [Anaerolineales bacterium]